MGYGDSETTGGLDFKFKGVPGLRPDTVSLVVEYNSCARYRSQ